MTTTRESGTTKDLIHLISCHDDQGNLLVVPVCRNRALVDSTLVLTWRIVESSSRPRQERPDSLRLDGRFGCYCHDLARRPGRQAAPLCASPIVAADWDANFAARARGRRGTDGLCPSLWLVVVVVFVGKQQERFGRFYTRLYFHVVPRDGFISFAS